MFTDMTDKLDERRFHREDVQELWNLYMRDMGALLEPAFVGNYGARLTILDCLELDRNRQSEEAMEKLNTIYEDCRTDADKAAWIVLGGLFMEHMGEKEAMCMAYLSAEQYHHGYVHPYVAMGMFYHEASSYDLSAEEYRLAIGCFQEAAAGKIERNILGALYFNLGSSYIMAHRLDEATEAMKKSLHYSPVLSGRSPMLAILAALQGNTEGMELWLLQAEIDSPKQVDFARAQTSLILSGKHPHHMVVPIAQGVTPLFWAWVMDNREELQQAVQDEEGQDAIREAVDPILLKIFFFERSPFEYFMEPTEKGVAVTIRDHHSRSIRAGVEEILADCPAVLKPYLSVEIGH